VFEKFGLASFGVFRGKKCYLGGTCHPHEKLTKVRQ